MTALEEEKKEVVWPKTGCVRTAHLWSHVHDYLAELFIIRWELLIFFGEMCCCKATNSWDWMLDTDWELLMVETLRVACKFLVVVLESPYTLFLSGPSDNLVSIHKSESKSGWVEGSSSYLSLNQLLYVS